MAINERDKCERGWLPIDGEADRAVFDRQDLYPVDILWPLTFIPCFTCNQESWNNPDLNINCN